MFKNHTVAIVIPCYKVSNFISKVVESIPNYVDLVVVVDDACPDKSYENIKLNKHKKKLVILHHSLNQGVGAATKTGFIYCVENKIDFILKIDGDGQMDTSLLPRFLNPLVNNDSDYVKGNRFFYLSSLKNMPFFRLIGNSFLSFITKFSSGYWNIFDPTNGYVGIKGSLIENIDLEKINNRFFFESDMLFRLYLVGAVVKDIPINSIYNDEKSNLSPIREICPFLFFNLRNFFKRLIYIYFLRDISVASFEIVLGLPIFFFGLVYGLIAWFDSYHFGISASNGDIVLSALCIIIGFQLIISFLNFDINNNPNKNK